MKIKIVVTGGAGFIGSHIAKHWGEKNAEVHVIDNFRTGSENNLKDIPNLIFHRGSITEKKLVKRVIEGAKYVHHLAAMVSVPESIDDPYGCVELNINGLLIILEAAKKFGVEKVVHSSSAAIYGENPESPKSTKMKPEPKSPYGITKLDGEYYLQVYNEQFGVNGIALRYFNVFGPKQDPNSAYAAAIPIFVNKAIQNEDLIIYGDGEQTRDFIYVDDVVEANILAATSKVNGTFNVACGKATSINQIAKKIIEVTNSRSKIVYAKERAGDIKHSLADIIETKKALGFNPKFDLDKGLENTINYFKELFKK